ncbi:ligand of Numb protein X 2-like isoform X2 [Varroa jacobsoni]|uniref:PDZ domain-containing protein n=1 Tax=Varroa destructor TaxID=109461 RepID=A0A7M7J9B8_VARDE|nr:ligand of Numb protein X 2-like isoform X2 [Varroa destructor]XP_022709839.1 ligand of Numb protein X 2-like isoform X2 [Varroa jacobsoni]
MIELDSDSIKYADADSLYEALFLTLEAILPNQDENRLSPRHAVMPKGRGAISTVRDFVESTIVLRKVQQELGLSITGGSDTYFDAVCVSEVHKDGAAYQDGRLKKGDVILAVNEMSMREVSWADAVRVLRDASSPVRLMILRENPQTLFTSSEKPSKFITVELHKSSVKDHLGLSFIQRTNGRGVFITYVPGSIAARCRRIMQGDRIMEINGVNVHNSNQKDVAEMIRNMDGAIVLLLGRVPGLTARIQEWARRKSQQSLRTRTSTWSSYTGNNKEKLQIQRPSLPLSSESYVVSFGNTVASMLVATSSPSGPGSRSREISPSPSIRRSRLSMVSENTNINDSEELSWKQHQQKSSRGAKDRASTSSDTALAEGTGLKDKEKNVVGRTFSATYTEHGSTSPGTAKAAKGKEPARTVPSIKITVF